MRAATLRSLLAAASHGYAFGMAVRNRWYDTGWPVRCLSTPVISVGNLTVGGTGKTPMTLWLCELLLQRGRRPAVLSRGYKAPGGGPPDELAMLARRCPRAIGVAHADRLRAGLLATEQYGADVLVLDDGYQHRRMARSLDLVLIDATCPFGYGRLLPRGLLREPLSSLRRADLLVVTRADQVTRVDLEGVMARLTGLAPGVPLLHAIHRPVGIVDLGGAPATLPDGPCRAVLFAAIARPTPFETTARSLGILPVATRWYPDHHAYDAGDAARLSQQARDAGASLLLTTEKDAVKLAGLPTEWPCPVRAVRVDIDFPDGGATIIAKAVDDALGSIEDDNAPRERPAN